jgi:Putative MetA-pathway of phenol degradation
MQLSWIRVTAARALSMCVDIPMAHAASVTQPGETIGVPAGEPLPEGLYVADRADWGCRNTSPVSCLGITIPVVTWSRPWTILGARVQFFSVTPLIEVGVRNTPYNQIVYNPAMFGQLAWNLGNGFGFSYALGAYVGIGEPVHRARRRLISGSRLDTRAMAGACPRTSPMPCSSTASPRAQVSPCRHTSARAAVT